jgi:endo-1,3(4)-beta-glucanase
LSTANHAAFSVSASLAPLGSSTPLLTLPLVQGMGLVTGIYNSATLLIQSGLYFKEISPVTSVGSSFRWTVFLNDGHTWAIYITPSAGGQAPALTLSSNGSAIQGPSNFNGLVQVAKLENQADDVIYDQSVGVYPSSGSVSATASGSYSLSWKKAGDTSKILMMFALPHHVQSFTSDTQRNVLNITLQTPTKGVATAVRADQWNLQEQLPTSMGFAPWSPTHQSVTSIPGAALPIISSALATELGEDMIAQTNIGSVYGSAKALAKFASLVYTANDLVGNKGLAGAALLQLEKAYGMWISNTAACTLVYDTVWGGVIDAGVWTDPNADYGNGMYNDHMFHYGYMVYAAAVIAHLDPSWLNQGVNKAWVNSLVRDFANSVDNDQYFPFSRNFDWYHGHSWASGLYASGDGNSRSSKLMSAISGFSAALLYLH